MRFFIDAMLSPDIVDHLAAAGHEGTSPHWLGTPAMTDAEIVDVAVRDKMVIVTENAKDFAPISTCPIILVRKHWWSSGSLPVRLATGLARWADENPLPVDGYVWLEPKYR